MRGARTRPRYRLRKDPSFFLAHPRTVSDARGRPTRGGHLQVGEGFLDGDRRGSTSGFIRPDHLVLSFMSPPRSQRKARDCLPARRAATWSLALHMGFRNGRSSRSAYDLNSALSITTSLLDLKPRHSTRDQPTGTWLATVSQPHRHYRDLRRHRDPGRYSGRRGARLPCRATASPLPVTMTGPRFAGTTRLAARNGGPPLWAGTLAPSPRGEKWEMEVMTLLKLNLPHPRKTPPAGHHSRPGS